MKIVAVILISLATALFQAYLHNFQIEYITCLGSAIIYFTAGILCKRYLFRSKFFWLFLLPIAAIMIFGMVTNHPFVFDAFIEFLIASCFYILGYKFDQLTNIKKFWLSLLSVSILIFFCFVINPIRNIKDYEIDPRALNSDSPTTDFAFMDDKGTKFSNDAFKGKIVLLDYWFIGCSPCYQKMEQLQRLSNYFKKDTTIVIYFVNWGVSDSYGRFLKEINRLQFTVPQLYDTNAAFTKANNITSFPYEIILKDGKIVSASCGYTKDMEIFYYSYTKSQLESLK